MTMFLIGFIATQILVYGVFCLVPGLHPKLPIARDLTLAAIMWFSAMAYITWWFCTFGG